jgi:hypothetical protein
MKSTTAVCKLWAVTQACKRAQLHVTSAQSDKDPQNDAFNASPNGRMISE